MSNYMTTNGDQVKDLLPRLRVLYILITLSSVLILGRLWYLQIIQGAQLQSFSEENRLKETKLPAPRGIIFDRGGNVLVDNLQSFNVTITPQYATKLKETAAAISPIINVDEKNIINKVNKSRRRNGFFFPIKIKKNLTLDQVVQLKRIRLYHPGLNINNVIIRNYPLNENGSQLFGYVAEISKKQISKYRKTYKEFQFDQGDIIGKSGIEKVWESKLRGYKGMAYKEVDAKGRIAPSRSLNMLGFEERPHIQGNNLHLTIDKDIQEAALKSMKREDKIGPRIGGLVAIKSNGEVLAWVNTPSFDPNEFSTGISTALWNSLRNDPNKPLRNKIIQDHYPPGSTFKPIVALAALQEEVIKKSTLIYAPGSIKFGRRTYHDHSRSGYGKIGVIEAIERSSNVFFYKMGIQLGIEKIAKYSRALNLGTRSNIKLENEVPGLIPDKKWKLKRFGEEWQPGENLSNAIGQGFILTTPLQMAVAFNSIGLEGKVFSPFLVKKITNQNGETILENKPTLVRDLSDKDSPVYISKENFKIVKEGMRRVSNGDHGTARWYKIPGIEIAGKTGTVQVQSFSADQIYEKCINRPMRKRHHGWFIGYAPAANPYITVAVLAEHACSGSAGGAPIVRDTIKAYFEKYHPELLIKKKGRAKI